jgi:hypothetical protein
VPTVEDMELPYFPARSYGHHELDLPRPIRSGLIVAAVGLLPLGLGLATVIRPLSGVVFAGIFVAAGAVQASLAYHELVGIRRRADGELRRKTQPHLRSSFARWRARELTSDRHRIALARAVARTVRDLSPAKLPGASPLNRVAARPHAALFLRLADRLADLDRPVAPQAVLQIEELMTSSESPLYARERAQELRPALLLSLQALDGVPDVLVVEPAPATRRPEVPGSGGREWRQASKTRVPGAASLSRAHPRLGRFAVARRRSER